MSRYRVRRLLRTGGMGMIHEAMRMEPGGVERAFAIKRIRPALSKNPE